MLASGVVVDPDSIVLRCMRDIDRKLDLVRDDVRELKERVSAVEHALVRQQSAIDRLADRTERLERRTELRNA